MAATNASGLISGHLLNQNVPQSPLGSKRSQQKQERLNRKRQAQLEQFARFQGRPLNELIANIDSPDMLAPKLLVFNLGSSGEVGRVRVEDLERAFGAFPGFSRVEMILGKPYAFVSFTSEPEARAASRAMDLQCIMIADGLSKPLFLAFALQEAKAVRTISDPLEVSQLIPGLILVPEFVSACQEDTLLNVIRGGFSQDPSFKKELKFMESLDEERPTSKWANLKRRRVQHFGYRFDYTLNGVDKTGIDPMPAYCNALFEKYANMFPAHPVPDQLTINEYWPGGGIAPHTDVHSVLGEFILSLSLDSGVVMEFRRVDGSVPSGYRTISVYLPPRSLIIMSGPARYDWEHGIRPRRTDIVDGRSVERGTRLSLTFRNVKSANDCKCGSIYTCDVAQSRLNLLKPRASAPKTPSQDDSVD
ncbi:hypothetical protein DFS34DRAFT_603777 [Phlyctochytrium arcticum]|nr:hypothetical protein DFS34DRAFT_603777 [Phlyctochytrium arcticum]